MSTLTKFVLGLAVAASTMLLAALAVADWDEGDGHKMHFPQLPDPNGWDVAWSNSWLGDDWVCSESGPVSDIHLGFVQRMERRLRSGVHESNSFCRADMEQ